MTSNVCAGQIGVGLPRIELAFDRFLMPDLVNRQAFSLSETGGKSSTPDITYDPVARIVTIVPRADMRLLDGHFYELGIVSPQSSADGNGLRAIDGATIDPAQPILPPCAPQGQSQPVLAFKASAAVAVPPPLPRFDFCADVMPIFISKCQSGFCHGPSLAEGLHLDTAADVTATALGVVSHEANTGPTSSALAPDVRLFGVNMPIIDPGSAGPANSWLMYKLLLAAPGPSSITPDGMGCGPDGGATDLMPTSTTNLHAIPWTWDPTGADASEWAVLSNLVPGREMPFPGQPLAPLSAGQGANLSLEELERVSYWIAQAAQGIPATCGCSH